MRFIGKFVKGIEEKETFSIQCLSPIPSVLQSQFGEEPYVFEGICSNKKNEKVFADLKKEKVRKTVGVISTLL